MCALRAAAFDHQDRFIAGGTAGGGHKAPRIMNMFEIEQNGAGFAVAGQEIEHIVDINIRAAAECDKVGKTGFPLLCPVQNGVGNGGGLGNKRQFAFEHRYRGKTGIQPLPGRKQPQAVRAEQADIIVLTGLFQFSSL